MADYSRVSISKNQLKELRESAQKGVGRLDTTDTELVRRTLAFATHQMEGGEESFSEYYRHVVWSPLPGSSTSVITCPVWEVLHEGTRGCSKTDTILMDFARDVGRGWGKNWRGILFRRTFKELDDVVRKSRKWFSRIHPDAVFHSSPVEYRWVFADGEELAFRHAREDGDYHAFHGHEIPWLGFEELTTWASLSFYHKMKSVSRTSVPDMPVRIRATTNPYGPGHEAVKSYFVDPAPSGSLIQDAKTGLLRMRYTGHWSENMYLPPDYPQIASDGASNEDQRRAWVDGAWDIKYRHPSESSGGRYRDDEYCIARVVEILKNVEV